MAIDTQPRAGVYGRQSTGKAKSIADQIAECSADVTEQGWALADTYQDGSSASRYARKSRADWDRVMADIDAGALDVLVLWESSRGDRDLPTWAGLLARCRDRGVKIRVTTHQRTYDLANPRDWRTLAEDGVDSAYESEKLSLRIRRGVATAAKAGRPPMGSAPYGYARRYDPTTGALVGQEPDPVTGPIAADIITKVSRAVPVSKICDDLNERKVKPPRGQRWYRQRVREIALSPAYIGVRIHKAERHPGEWAPLVDEATHYAAVRVLTEPGRLALARPGRQQHLLTYLAECHRGHQIGARETYYVCQDGCLSIRRQPVDELVTEVVLARLERPDAYRALRRAGEDADKEALAARGLVSKLRTDLDGWRLSAAKGETSPESLAVIEAELTAQIRTAEARANAAALPPALRQILAPGADVRERWTAAPLPARREIIRTLMTVVIRPSGRNAYMPVEDRVHVAPRR